jgi:predicted  nucleic acid-binding Zn-ribbon protein
MPLTASPDAQARLLDLQAIDTKLQQLAHRSASLPQRATIAELETERESVRLGLVEETGTLEDARLELKRVESDVEVVEARIARDTGRLESTSSVKDVAGLEAELASLRKRQSDLEDIQLAVMERIEELEAAVATTTARHEDIGSRVATAEAERDELLGEIAAERDAATAERASIVEALPADLVALYERQRERYGAGASLLRGAVSSASGVKLNESDMAAIRAAAPDDVVLCPDSNAILVRTAESGL